MTIALRDEYLRPILLFVTSLSMLSACGIHILTSEDNCGTGLSASISQATGAPVAVIDPLPDEVSNGTQLLLDGSGSYDPDGVIFSYAWKLESRNDTYRLYGEFVRFRFAITGLYKITLTVTDNDGHTGVNFTAVYSVPDSDQDGLPDWWEVKHFSNLTLEGTDNPDGDDYNNLEEFARGTDPLNADPAEGLFEANRRLIIISVAAVVAVVVAIYPFWRRKRKDAERKKMELAIEIQKALDEE